MIGKKHKTISIRMTVLGVFLIVAGLTAGLALGLQYHFSSDLAATAAQNSFTSTAGRVRERIRLFERQNADLVSMLGQYHDIESFPDKTSTLHALSFFSGAMQENSSIYAIYVGYPSGDFFELINLESSRATRAALQAAPQDRWVLITVTEKENGIYQKATSYLDDTLEVRLLRKQHSDYDPRNRPWYKLAKSNTGVVRTAPYLFTNLKAPGVTYAQAVENGNRVVAVDISLEWLSSFLSQQQEQPDSTIFVFNNRGEIIVQGKKKAPSHPNQYASPLHLSPEEKNFISKNKVITASNEKDWPPFDFTLSGNPQGYSIELLNLLAQRAGFSVTYINGLSWSELQGKFRKGEIDLLHSLLPTPERQKMGIFSNQYLPMPQSFAVKAGTELPTTLAELKGKTIAIPEGWATASFIASHQPDIKLQYVTTSLEALRAVSDGNAYATLDSQPVLRFLASTYFLDNVVIGDHAPQMPGFDHQGLHFLVRPEKSPLAEILNKALSSMTEADRRQLELTWLQGGPATAPNGTLAETIPDQRFLEMATISSPEGAFDQLFLEGKKYFCYSASIESKYLDNQFVGMLVPRKSILRPYMKKVRFSLIATVILLLFLIPLVAYCSSIIVNPINALAAENEKVRERRYDEVIAVNSNITEIRGLSRSMVTMAGSIKNYELSLKDLMDSFIRLIATAIDQKSPYTGGHCARVPELAIMLAQKANSSTNHPFQDFLFHNDDEWREFRTAAWLHDCGKVSTPEFIVDKATKLETIYNRIHEIRMRFEVLLRDVEIDYWQNLANGGVPLQLETKRSSQKKQIIDDFTFVASCNIGGEFMREEDIARLQQISNRTWIRHLDDRLGLGQSELQRYTAPPLQLPCREPLLADRTEHLIPRDNGHLNDDSIYGFTMERPEYKTNLGEIYNLSIPRGTLTTEDRYIINEHITTTIKMLETLPFPENMERIPDYAGAHHETLDGNGYPRSLSGEDIGMVARIITIADIFEALTAGDRPYKTAKKLSEALHIMKLMVKDKHLDRDLFLLFLQSETYLEYAKRFLHAEQIDEVDIKAILSDIA